MLISFSSFHDIDCNKLKHCKLQYLDGPEDAVYMIIDGDKLTEYDEHTQYFLKADLKWLSDCEYETTLTEVTFPSFTFPLGEKMRVRINKIENNIVELTSNISDKEFTVRYKLIR